MARDEVLLIGTPAYNGQVQANYVHSLLAISACGIRYSLFTVTNDSLVARARNTITAQFYGLENYTHLMFLDADVAIQGKDVERLLGHGKDVIAAAVQTKARGRDKPTFGVGEVLSRSGTLASVNRVGTAVLILSRAAVNALVHKAQQDNRIYQARRESENDVLDGVHFDVFRQGQKNGQYVSEDYQACDDLRDAGFEIFVDLGIRTRHYGIVELSG